MKSKIQSMLKQAKRTIEKYHVFIYCALLFILTLPRSINNFSPIGALAINILKFASAIIICFLYILQKPKLSKTSVIFLLYFGYIAAVTLCNGENPIVALKAYSLNTAMVVLFNLIFSSKKAVSVLRFVTNYFITLLAVNLIQIIIYRIIGYQTETDFILGIDNRFILYILPTLICCYYLIEAYPKEKTIKRRLIFTYIIGLLSLVLCKSIAALAILAFIILGSISAKVTNKIRFNTKIIAFIIIVLSAALVLFRFHYLFRPIITQVLHKGMSLSYRTYIWDVALNLLFKNPVNLIFGFGFFDFTSILQVLPFQAARVNHFHNLLVDVGFAGGLVGLIIYLRGIFNISSNINKIKKNNFKIVFTSILAGLLILLIFESFELYQIYYFILLLLSEYNEYEKQTNLKHTRQYAKKILKSHKDTIGILLATYNGEKYIAEQIDSIIAQSYPNWSLWVSDDGSTDNTVKILKDYQKQYPNKIFIIKNTTQHHGTKYNFNNLMQKAEQYPYYAFCDQDDVWGQNKLLYMLAETKREESLSPQPILTYCDSYVVNQKLRIITPSLIHFGHRELPNQRQLRPLLLQCYAPGCAMMFNAKLREKMNSSIYLETEAHDWWAMLIAGATGKIVYLDMPLHYYRQHANNLFGAHIGRTPYAKMLNKIKDREQNSVTWHTYQDVVTKQASELQQHYANETVSKVDLKDINRFINIMQEQNRVKRLIKLAAHRYWPIQKERIFRLVL